MTTLIELCAGSAAVSLRWMGQQPPLRWQGGKRAFADAILRAAGLVPREGVRRGNEVLLCEPGPLGDAWALWAERGVSGTVDRILSWAKLDPESLWDRLAGAPVPSDAQARVAFWAVLQFWGYGGKPVRGEGGRWCTHGFDHEGAYRTEHAAMKRSQGQPKYRMGRDQRLPMLADRLRALNLDRVAAVCRSIAEVPARAGAVTYIDPPYLGTTCAYGFMLTRPQLLELAEQRAQAGELVLVSEAEPLPLRGWTHILLPAPRARGRNNFTKQRAEWLTVCPALAAVCKPQSLILGLPGLV